MATVVALLLAGCAAPKKEMSKKSTANCSAMSKEIAQARNDSERYLLTFYPMAVEQMERHGIPASITLAQGLLESGAGKSKLASEGKNHFGIKADKRWKGRTMKVMDNGALHKFRVYDNAGESYEDHSQFLIVNKRYASLFKLKKTDYKGWAKGLKKAGYATLPVYANVLIKLIEDYNLTQYDQMVVKGKFKYKKDKGQKTNEEKKTPKATNKRSKVDGDIVYIPYKITDSEVVDKTSDGRYIRENNGSKFIYAKAGEKVSDMAKMLGIYDYQIINYNNLGKRSVLKDNEIIYIEPKRNKAMRRYKYHTIQKGETLSYVSRLYAVKLKSLFKMNDMDENTILHVGDNIRLR